jgi:ryanodine receptor 2
MKMISPELLELIAEKVHNRWMKNRILEGWIYGKERNDVKKETPCLVPYNELTEEEKEYDRETALETIRALNELGYKVIKEKRL